MRSEAEMNYAIEEYAKMVRHICLYHLKNEADTEDIFQNVFMKYMMYDGDFESEEHEKAWIIRVSVNGCKDHLKSMFRRTTVTLDQFIEQTTGFTEDQSEVLEAVMALPDKYKDVIYLHYYEGYNAAEIGKILKKRENTIYSILSRGRNLLKKELGGESFAE